MDKYPLYRPELEHESCGVGAIVERLAHRAGSDALGTTGDGVGIMTQLPHELFSLWAREEGIPFRKWLANRLSGNRNEE